MTTTSQASEFFAAAAKLKDIEDVDKELDDRKRELASAQKDLVDARVSAAQVKAQADLYAREKTEAATAAAKKITDDLAAAKDRATAALTQQQNNAQAALEAIDAKMAETNKAIVKAKAELADWQIKIRRVRAAFEDAQKLVEGIDE